jgi:Uma2 family endonuclease
VYPVLVSEVLVEGEAEKDLERNPELYLAVPSVREYWVLDGRADPNEPTLIQHRRYGKRWVVRRFPYGSTFATKLLPGFTLLIDPRK